jgi:hypothetical protein
MSPEQFWALHPIEFWWLCEAKKPPRMYGRLTEAEAAECYRLAYGKEPDEE